MQLWRDIPIDWTAVSCSNLAAINLPVVSADDCRRCGLCVVFELVEGNADALSWLRDTLIAATRRLARRIWRGNVASQPARCSIVLIVLPSDPDTHRTLVVAQSARRSVDAAWLSSQSPRRNDLGKAELLDQSPLPFARDNAALRPVVLFLRGELRLVVGLRLPAESGFEIVSMRLLSRRLRLCWALTFRSARSPWRDLRRGPWRFSRRREHTCTRLQFMRTQLGISCSMFLGS